jgi:hypothetical protein
VYVAAWLKRRQPAAFDQPAPSAGKTNPDTPDSASAEVASTVKPPAAVAR